MRKKISVSMIVILVLLSLYVLSLVYPFFWSLMATFKGRLEHAENPLALPAAWKLDNFIGAFNKIKSDIVTDNGIRTVFIEEMLLNSLLYSIGGAFFNVLSSCILAYATARFDFKFSKVVYSVVIVTMIMPIVGSLPSEIQVAKNLGLYDNMIGMWVMKMGFVGLYYLIFYEVFKRVPRDFYEAAYVDGASNLMVLVKIMLPLVSATFGTVMLIRFIDLWNDYTITMSLMPNIKTLAFGLFEFSTSAQVSSMPERLAGCFVLILPVLTIFLIFNERIMGNISMGGIKE
jgi:ABC-type glycerol-3-phosphate transport system permease component